MFLSDGHFNFEGFTPSTIVFAFASDPCEWALQILLKYEINQGVELPPPASLSQYLECHVTLLNVWVMIMC